MGTSEEGTEVQAFTSEKSFTTQHNVFVEHRNVRRLDGSAVEIADLTRQQAQTTCEICGEPVINTDWPTGEWRHMAADETARYTSQEEE